MDTGVLMKEYREIGDEEEFDGFSPRNMVSRLRGLGWSWADIGRELGTSRQATWELGQKYSMPPLDHEAVRKAHFPWKIEGKFCSSAVYKDMCRHGRFAVTAGHGMSTDSIKRVLAFHRKLRDNDLVVEFDPAIPPSLRDKVGGFSYRDRVAADNGLMVRVNEYTNITEPGKDIWRLPPVQP